MKLLFSKVKDRLQFLRSLKVRIFIIILAVGIIPTMVLRNAILQNYEKRAVSVRTTDVQNQFKILANHLITYNYLSDTSSEVVNAELSMLSDLYDGRVIIIDQNCNIIKDTYGISEGKTIVSEEVMLCMKGQTSSNYDAKNKYIEVTTPIVDNTTQEMAGGQKTVDGGQQKSQVKGVMLTSVSTDNIATNVELLRNQATILQFTAMILLIGIAWLLSHILVRPFDRVTSAIREINDGFNTEQISVPDYVETEHIVNAFNELLGRMRTLDESRQEFVSNVSHELKTPLTSMKVLADSLIGQEDTPVELYREFMSDIGAEIDRENKIINDLLSLVKMDKSAGNINIESINVNELLERIMKRLKPIAQRQNVELVMESFRPVVAEVDEVKLTLALTNLIENGIKYNNAEGWVHVTLNADHQNFFVTVEDNGIGIPKEAQTRIFERFYRVDKSHSREIGGTGLGLAIARNAIIMHRGAIKVHSLEGEGTTFTVRIPLTYIVG